MLLVPELKTLELAEKAGVTTRTVHWYMQQGLINPINPGGKPLRFSQEELDKIKLIKYLQQNEGLSLDGIKVMIMERGDEKEHEFFEKLKQLSEGSAEPGEENVYSHILSALIEAKETQSLQAITLNESDKQTDFKLKESQDMFESPQAAPVRSYTWKRVELAQGIELQFNEQQELDHGEEINRIIAYARKILSNVQ